MPLPPGSLPWPVGRLCLDELRPFLESFLCLQAIPAGVSRVVGGKNHWRSSCKRPSTSNNFTNGETKGQRWGRPWSSSQGYFRTQTHDPTCLWGQPKEKHLVFFGVSSALTSLGSRFVISWCLQVLPSELLCCDLSEMQIGSGCFPAPVPLEKSYALCKPFKVLRDPASVPSSATTFQSHGASSGCLVPPRPPAPRFAHAVPAPLMPFPSCSSSLLRLTL